MTDCFDEQVTSCRSTTNKERSAMTNDAAPDDQRVPQPKAFKAFGSLRGVIKFKETSANEVSMSEETICDVPPGAEILMLGTSGLHFGFKADEDHHIQSLQYRLHWDWVPGEPGKRKFYALWNFRDVSGDDSRGGEVTFEVLYGIPYA
jgi:hypothetical protein